MAAVAALVGAFVLGAGALNVLVPPSSPVYGLRLMLDQARGTFVPGHPNIGQYALSYQFPALQIPAVGGVTRTANGKVGGLPAALALTAAEACATGNPCGRFVVSLAGLSTPASAKFGELKGTFACGPDGCTLALVKATGVFARVSTPRISVSGARLSEGRLTAKMASRGEWVAEVAMAAESLEAGGMLPAGLTVSDLVSDAATNDKDVRRSGGPNGRLSKFAPNTAAAGANIGGTVNGGNTAASGPRGTGAAGSAHGGNTAGSSANRSGGPPGSGGVNVDASGDVGSAGPNGHGGGFSVNGAASAGDDGVNDNASAGSVGGGGSINAGASGGSGAVGAGGGANVNAGASGGSGAVGAGGGASVNAGATGGGGAVGAGGGANVNGGATGGSGGVGAGGGANVNGGATGGSGGVGVGGGANVNGGGSGIGVGGGINVNGGGINLSGGAGGGGSGAGGSREAGSGSR
jgi:hypothetical protein